MQCWPIFGCNDAQSDTICEAPYLIGLCWLKFQLKSILMQMLKSIFEKIIASHMLNKIVHFLLILAPIHQKWATVLIRLWLMAPFELIVHCASGRHVHRRNLKLYEAQWLMFWVRVWLWDHRRDDLSPAQSWSRSMFHAHVIFSKTL